MHVYFIRYQDVPNIFVVNSFLIIRCHGGLKIKTEIQTPQSKTRNILIVDDRKNNLILLEGLLAEDGYNVITAVNGKDAIEKLQIGKRCDLIISDILMPVMDGFAFCRNVKRDEKFRDIPFVFCTATFVGSEDEELALKLGAKEFIRKPFEPDKLLKIIQGLLKEVSQDKIVIQESFLEDDKAVHTLYSERLVGELEKKVMALEREISERKKAEGE